MDVESFAGLVRRLRAGDQAAAAAVAKEYGPIIRQAVKPRIRRLGLSRLIDPGDISQWVLARFFARLGAGHFRLERPNDLRGLLVIMALHRLRDRARHFHAEVDALGGAEVVDAKALEARALDQSDPAAPVDTQDLLDAVRRHMSAEEWGLATARAAGQSWEEVAAAHGKNPDALRVKLKRAADRVRSKLLPTIGEASAAARRRTITGGPAMRPLPRNAG